MMPAMNRLLMRLAPLAAAAALAAAASAQIKVGDQADHTFRTPPAGGLGVQSLKDLRGKTVLVEFWGTR